ncbi:MAG: acyl-CoA carboxylase subunit beta [Acidobacteria bacterium]|nr:acyl-CoA carboxylase subunit beta [Acidobacteriota bacterium]MBI3488007.1 acyl-CoA carboxylase subunit beta [Acidobacteriota bacterium]
MQLEQFHAEADRIRKGGSPKAHEKNAESGKLFARERIRLLVDEGSFMEDGLFANALAEDLPADGVITGTATVDGRPVALMANDSTVKAGSWGARTVEKIIRIQEVALRMKVPMLYLVDSAGARITDQLDMFPGRRHAGTIFHMEVALSGLVPQVCLLFGPSAAGGAYIPAFCDVVVMVEGNASMYLGSPRMAEMVIGEKISLEDLGGARMHCSVSGCGDFLCKTEEEAIALGRRYLGYFPQHCEDALPMVPGRPVSPQAKALGAIVPADIMAPFQMKDFIEGLVDEGSFLEVKKLFAGEVITGLARLNGRPVGIVANQPRVKGGVLFVDSADKATRFITLCDAFGLPLVFLSDVPGFMIGSAVEKQGIIRHGAKMISAMSSCSTPRFCVVVRKAYGAGLYAMSGPGFDPDATLALPTASIAVMGAEAAVNAVFANKIAEKPEAERAAYVQQLREEYNRDIDLKKLGAGLHVDAIVDPADLRGELAARLARARRRESWPPKRRAVTPV